MKKIVKLTESQLINIVKRVIREENESFSNFLDRVSVEMPNGVNIGLIPKGGGLYTFEEYNYSTDLPIKLTVNDIDNAFINREGLVISVNNVRHTIDRDKKLTTKSIR